VPGDSASVESVPNESLPSECAGALDEWDKSERPRGVEGSVMEEHSISPPRFTPDTRPVT
jgi:hypothetical protein